MYYRLIDNTFNYLINNMTAIEKKIIKIKFKGSKSLIDKRTRIKNIGNVKENANFMFKKILNKKKKKELISIFIINIKGKFAGEVVKANRTINPKLKIRKIDFFQYFPVASIINFNYNRKLWLKLKKIKRRKKLLRF